jgi:hypothetical protein
MQVYFVAEGRLGRRFLEEHLLPILGITCHGEKNMALLGRLEFARVGAGHGPVIPTAKNLDALTTGHGICG